MDAQPGDAKRDDANDTEHDDNAGLMTCPVAALGELHSDIARVEGVDGRHVCENDDEARCGRAVFCSGMLVVSDQGARKLWFESYATAMTRNGDARGRRDDGVGKQERC